MNKIIDSLSDFSVLSVIGCLCIPFAYMSTEAERWAFLLNKYLLGCIALLIVTVTISGMVAKKQGVVLSFWEKKHAQWYLMNGIFICILMDGLSVFHALPGLHDLYYLLDARYKGDVTVDVISLFELFIMAPLCIWQYFALRTKASYRDALQILVSAFQFMGTIMYLGTELYWHKGAHISIDTKLTFSSHHLTFFWLPVVLGCGTFLVVPLYMIVKSFRSISSVTSAAEGNLIPMGNKTFRISSKTFNNGNVEDSQFSPIKPPRARSALGMAGASAAALASILTDAPFPTSPLSSPPVTDVPVMASLEQAAAEEPVAVIDEAVEAAAEEPAAEPVAEPVVEPVAAPVVADEEEQEEEVVVRPPPRRRSTRRSVAPQR